MTRRTPGSCASGISEGLIGLFWLVLISEGCWVLNVASGMGPCISALFGSTTWCSDFHDHWKEGEGEPNTRTSILQNMQTLTKHPIGRYRVWFGHSFHSQLCPLPLPVESLISTLWCSPKNAQNSLSPSSSSSYPPRRAEREQGHGWKLPCPQMGSPRLCKSCSADIQSNPFLWVI